MHIPSPFGGGSRLSAVTAADFDTDGHVDVVFGHINGSYGFLKGRGDGSLADAVLAATAQCTSLSQARGSGECCPRPERGRDLRTCCSGTTGRKTPSRWASVAATARLRSASTWLHPARGLRTAQIVSRALRSRPPFRAISTRTA